MSYSPGGGKESEAAEHTVLFGGGVPPCALKDA